MDRASLFSGSLATLEKTLDLRSIRHNLIASNVANIDTPNYRAFDIMVEEEMQRSGNAGRPSIFIERTHPEHIELHGRCGLTPKIHMQPDLGEDLRNDGNSVDLDKQMTKLSENSLLYNTAAQILSRKYQGLKNVIQGGRK
jgi:flagellar basal-body rod protein FlgB